LSGASTTEKTFDHRVPILSLLCQPDKKSGDVFFVDAHERTSAVTKNAIFANFGGKCPLHSAKGHGSRCSVKEEGKFCSLKFETKVSRENTKMEFLTCGTNNETKITFNDIPTLTSESTTNPSDPEDDDDDVRNYEETEDSSTTENSMVENEGRGHFPDSNSTEVTKFTTLSASEPSTGQEPEPSTTRKPPKKKELVPIGPEIPTDRGNQVKPEVKNDTTPANNEAAEVKENIFNNQVSML
jgi:hypothetical protein